VPTSGKTHWLANVYDQIKNKSSLGYESLGEQTVKNITELVRVYRVKMEPEAADSLVGAASHGRSPEGQPDEVVPTGSPPVLPLPDKPSIAVLPFANMSSDPEQEYFSDGMTEDLITDLSKLSGLFVIARNSVFTYKGKAVKVQDVSRELGVRYVVEGSVRKAGDRVRITAQLVDASTGHHLWADRYDGELKDIFALQDAVTQKIVAALQVKLTKGEQEHLGRAPTDNIEAYDYFLRGWEFLNRFTKEANIQAQQLFERAVELDPEYAEAYAGLGMTYWFEWAVRFNQDPQYLERAFELTQRAVAFDDSLSQAHTLLGWIYLAKKQYEEAFSEMEKAIVLNPNDAHAYARLGGGLLFLGNPEEAIRLEEKAMRLDPHYPPLYLLFLGMACYQARRYEEAITAFKRARIGNPEFLGAPLFLTIAYSELGREEEARVEAAEVLRLNPHFSVELFSRRMLPYRDPAVTERLVAALLKAGLK